MTMLEIIRKSIEKEKEKVYYLQKEEHPEHALSMIVLRLHYLHILEADEIVRQTKQFTLHAELAGFLQDDDEKMEIQ